MAITRLNGDPFATAALAIPPEFGRAHRRTDQARCAQRIRDSAGTIIPAIVKRFVAAPVPVRFRAKLICSPNCSLHRHRRFLGRSRLTDGVNMRLFASNYRSRDGKEIGDCRWNNQRKNNCAKQNLTANRIDKSLRGCLIYQKTNR